MWGQPPPAVRPGKARPPLFAEISRARRIKPSNHFTLEMRAAPAPLLYNPLEERPLLLAWR